jgi:hypothetical protein
VRCLDPRQQRPQPVGRNRSEGVSFLHRGPGVSHLYAICGCHSKLTRERHVSPQLSGDNGFI